jgi:hypothetical protein
MTKCITSASSSSATTSTFAGTKKYYVDWATFKCVQDCAVGTAAGCGGFADGWNFLHESKEQCCRERVSWDYKECMN